MSRRIKRISTILQAFAGLALACSANTLHVSISGSDEATGSEQFPFRTIFRATQAAGPGDTVLIHDGVYRETITPVCSGRPEAPIVFSAAAAASPVITGCDLLTNWTRPEEGIITTDVSWDLGDGRNQLFLNGEPIPEARHPNRRSAGVFEHDLVPVFFDTPEQIRNPVFKGRSNQWVGAHFFGHGYEAWAFQCALVASSANEGLTLDPASMSKPWFSKPGHTVDPARIAAGEGAGFIYGISECLDAPGEWLLLDGTLRMIPPEGFCPEKDKVEMRRRPWAVDLNKKNHIVLRGLRFIAGAVRVQGDSNLLENCEVQWGSHFLNFSDGYSQDGGLPYGAAVMVNGSGNVLEKCRISKTAGAGILLQGSGNFVARCLIEEVNYAGTYGSGITIGGNGQTVVFNTVRQTGRDGIQIATGEAQKGGHRIFLNEVSFPGQICKDTALIYTFATDGAAEAGVHTRIAFNWFHDNLFPMPAPGIYLDNYTQNYLVDHNVVWNVPHDAGIRLNAPALGHRIYNNTLFYTEEIGQFTYNVFPLFNPNTAFWTSKEMYSFESENNLWLGDSPGRQLVDPAHFDFSLKPGAAAAGAGSTIPGISERPDGTPPDLGAIQSGEPTWKPGHEGFADPRLLSALKINLEP